jgi:hypothetical protein
MKFIDTTIENYYQILDPAWLKNDLFRSLFYLHSQPPLFNFLIGGVLILFDKNSGLIFDILYQIFAFGSVLLIYWNLRRFGANRWLAFLASAIWTVYPAFLYFQNLLFYPIPIVFLLLLATSCLLRSIKYNLSYHPFFLSLLALALLRTTYSLIYMILVSALLIAFEKNQRKQIAKAAIVPVALLLALTIKNIFLFGESSPSSWLGMNFSKVAIGALTKKQKETLVDQGTLSSVILSAAFEQISEYPKGVWGPAAENCVGPAALCEPFKTNGRPNFNFIGYIPVSHTFMSASLYAVRHYPLQYLLQVKGAINTFFSPAHRTVGVNERNFAPIIRWADFTDGLVCEEYANVYYANHCTGLAILFLASILAPVFLLISRGKELRANRLVTPIYFLLMTVLFSTLIDVSLDIGENNRFRFEIDALALILFVASLQIIANLLLAKFLAQRKTTQRGPA